MCGIVGYIGKSRSLPILLDGLKKLEYRGYDSAGIAYFENEEIKLVKSVGRIKNLVNKINESIDSEIESTIGIGHTRWATHGKVNELNSHPHQVGEITIVHNGIIENYLELRDFLKKNGYSFYGNTDTEIACAYIDYEYKNSQCKDIIKVLNKCCSKFVGSYAIVVMIKSITDKLFVMKKDSPLIIAKGENENFIASDIMAFADKSTSYIILDDLEVGVITDKNISIYKDKKKKELSFNIIDTNLVSKDLGSYRHYMLKEINEQVELVNKWNDLYLDKLEELIDLSIYNKIHIIGCGTAYYSGLVGKYLLENYGDIEVNVFIASEYRYQKLFVDSNTLVIAVSQSGETADTLACIKRVKELGCKTLGIINVRNSSIDRAVDNVIYTEACQEVAVASTKAYLSQIYTFSLLAVKLGINNSKFSKDLIINEYKKLAKLIDKMINLDYCMISRILSKQENIFYLGRGIDYITMLEGALKIKEISYIYSCAIEAGELKHGTISLIENGTCVVCLITDEKLAGKTISNIKEVKSRGAYVILLVSNKLFNTIEKDAYDNIVVIDDVHEVIRPLINVIPLQLIAYYTALKKGCDIDKPRNLAKSVTVE